MQVRLTVGNRMGILLLLTFLNFADAPYSGRHRTLLPVAIRFRWIFRPKQQHNKVERSHPNKNTPKSFHRVAVAMEDAEAINDK